MQLSPHFRWGSLSENDVFHLLEKMEGIKEAGFYRIILEGREFPCSVRGPECGDPPIPSDDPEVRKAREEGRIPTTSFMASHITSLITVVVGQYKGQLAISAVYPGLYPPVARRAVETIPGLKGLYEKSRKFWDEHVEVE